MSIYRGPDNKSEGEDSVSRKVMFTDNIEVHL